MDLLPLVFGLELKYLVLCQFLQPTCALGKNTFVNLNISPIDAGGQKCTQGAPHEKARKKQVKMIN